MQNECQRGICGDPTNRHLVWPCGCPAGWTPVRWSGRGEERWRRGARCEVGLTRLAVTVAPSPIFSLPERLSYMRPFPLLPKELSSIVDAEHLRLERLAQQPEQWPTLSEEELLSLLVYALIVSAITADVRRWPALEDLYGLVVRRTSSDARVAVLLNVSAQIESMERGDMAVAEVFALLPFIRFDPSGHVVSSATLAAAVSAGGKKGDSFEGRTTMLQLALNCTDQARQCAMMQGLLALGDAGVADALRGCWRPMSDQLRRELCHTACGLPFPSTVEFLLTWAEDALAAGEGEREMCRPISALCVLARVASGARPGQYGGRGIYELVRNYPAAVG